MAFPLVSGSPGLMVWDLWPAFSFSSFSLQEKEMEKGQETKCLPAPGLPDDSGQGTTPGRTLLFQDLLLEEPMSCLKLPRIPPGGQL